MGSFQQISGVALVVSLLAIASVENTSAATFDVTSTSQSGPGSLLEAVDFANNNPGEDTIMFAAGLQVDAATPASSTYQFLIQLTESVIIDGNGGALNGVQTWVNSQGVINSTTACPGKTPGDLILAKMPGFMEVGVFGQDNSSISVTVKNLAIKQFNQVAEVRDKASLTFENFEAQETWATYDCRGRVMIVADEGANLTIKDSRFVKSETWAARGQAPAILAFNAGDLSIEGTLFDSLSKRDQPAIQWFGETGTEVNIVSSRFRTSGGISIGGESKSNIVNTIWVNDSLDEPGFGDRFINYSNSDMNIVATSLRWNSNECNAVCQAANNYNLIERQGAGAVNFLQSAAGFNFVAAPGSNAVMTLGGTGTNGFTADEYTWIQPTETQDASALKAITNEGALLTDLPAFNGFVNPVTEDIDVEMVTPAFPGELIDVIPAGIPLINPISSSPIEYDVVGNPRVDNNAERDIGALQLTLAPLLLTGATGDRSIDLRWSRPQDPPLDSFTGYQVCYGTGPAPLECPGTPSTISSAPDVATGQVGGLNNGVDYWFLVRGVTSSSAKGPWSNSARGTPYGPFTAPSLTAAPGPGACEASLSWTAAEGGGRTISSYTVLWRLVGSSSWLGHRTLGSTELSTVITGLACSAAYEFTVTAQAIDSVSGQSSSSSSNVAQSPSSPTAIAVSVMPIWLLGLMVLAMASVASVRIKSKQ